MIAVIFEVFPAEGKVQEYLDIAAKLKLVLENIDGFISIERFSSFSVEGKLLSLSFWRDEKAIEEWRNIESHRLAQEKGRDGVFSDYRLRVANVSRDYGMLNREQAPSDSRTIHDNSNKRACSRYVVWTNKFSVLAVFPGAKVESTRVWESRNYLCVRRVVTANYN